MTYCVGMLLRDGLVIMADTRTNAGVDSISVYRKLHLFELSGDRVFVIASAGNLSVTQAAIALLQQGMRNPETGAVETLAHAQTVTAAAEMTGRALRRKRDDTAEALRGSSINSDASLLFGGRIGAAPVELFLIYGPGNFIASSEETPFLQIGERKYGKPILDRALRYDTSLPEAVRLGLLSFDSTLRSNLAVGMPIDIAILRHGVTGVDLVHRVAADDPYFRALASHWEAALLRAVADSPMPPYALRPSGPAADPAGCQTPAEPGPALAARLPG